MSDDIGVAAVTHLKTVTEVTDEVAARIYPDVLLQGATLPALVYEVPSNTSEDHLGGAAGLAHARVRVLAYADTRIKANQVAEVVRTKGLKAGFRGTMGDMTIRYVKLEAGPYGAMERPSDGSDSWRYITWQDFMIGYKQTIPS